MTDILNLTGSEPLYVDTLAVNLLLSIVLSSLIAMFYTRYGRSLSNRRKFANTLPVLSLTTVLIIAIVKSSLALSLGLVGALSIVRFRTAIKEPEELTYLFMAIAVGLGLGADQRLPTLVSIAIILGYLFVRAMFLPRASKDNLFLNIATPNAERTFSQINALLGKHVETADMRRLDQRNDMLQVTYLVRCQDDAVVANLMDSLRAELPEAEFTFVEQDTTLGG